jgi:uncharacterized protein YqjF (DUF2071 family)
MHENTVDMGPMTTEPTVEERLRGRAEPAEKPVMRQIWRHLGFLHWPVDRDIIARLLPLGLEPDTFDGVAYIGIVPFTIPLSRTAGVSLPLAPKFHELNLRTYVHRNGRSPGVWFFSLDAASRLVVVGARLTYGLPYFHARMSMQVTGDPASPTIVYESRRRARAQGLAEFHARYGPTAPAATAAPGTLEFFLVERYLLYSCNGRTLSEARVHHVPYPLQPATVEDVTETLTRTAGLSATSGGPPTFITHGRSRCASTLHISGNQVRSATTTLDRKGQR